MLRMFPVLFVIFCGVGWCFNRKGNLQLNHTTKRIQSDKFKNVLNGWNVILKIINFTFKFRTQYRHLSISPTRFQFQIHSEFKLNNCAFFLFVQQWHFSFGRIRSPASQFSRLNCQFSNLYPEKFKKNPLIYLRTLRVIS